MRGAWLVFLKLSYRRSYVEPKNHSDICVVHKETSEAADLLRLTA